MFGTESHWRWPRFSDFLPHCQKGHLKATASHASRKPVYIPRRRARLAVRPTLEWSDAGPSRRDQRRIVAVAGPVHSRRHQPAKRNHVSFQRVAVIREGSRRTGSVAHDPKETLTFELQDHDRRRHLL